jgi:hypothetical protein
MLLCSSNFKLIMTAMDVESSLLDGNVRATETMTTHRTAHNRDKQFSCSHTDGWYVNRYDDRTCRKCRSVSLSSEFPLRIICQATAARGRQAIRIPQPAREKEPAQMTFIPKDSGRVSQLNSLQRRRSDVSLYLCVKSTSFVIV